MKFSSVYKSKAQLMEDQNDFLNAVARFETDESPEKVQTKLQSIEKELKKNPPIRFGPRTIDLDLLLYGVLTQDDANLTIPHPRMFERRFVLEPLSEFTHEYEELLTKTLDQECSKTNLSLE